MVVLSSENMSIPKFTSVLSARLCRCLMDAQCLPSLLVVVHGKINLGISFLLFLASFYELHSYNIMCGILLVLVHLKTISQNFQRARYIVLHHILPAFEQSPTDCRLKIKEAFFLAILITNYTCLCSHF